MALVSCPTCATQLDVPEDFLGKKVRCATCSTVFEANVGAVERSEPPPLPPREKPAPPGGRRDWRDDDHHDDDERPSGMRRDALPHRGGLILGLGIGSLVGGAIELGLGICCCSLPLISIPLGAVAWILGQGDLAQMNAGQMDPDGRSNTHGGYICGIIGCCLGVLSLVCLGVKIVTGIGGEAMRHW